MTYPGDTTIMDRRNNNNNDYAMWLVNNNNERAVAERVYQINIVVFFFIIYSVTGGNGLRSADDVDTSDHCKLKIVFTIRSVGQRRRRVGGEMGNILPRRNHKNSLSSFYLSKKKKNQVFRVSVDR